MISEQTVWDEIWPAVEGLIQATLAEDDKAVKQWLIPGGQAAHAHDLFGYPVFDILLKTVLGRGRLGLTRAIEIEKGKYVYIEYAWPDPEVTDNSYTAADVVSVRLGRRPKGWRIEEVNPASIDLPLTGARARGILVTSKTFSDTGKAPSEPWILPVALYGGALQMPLRETAMRDQVEELLLPGLQHRTYGITSLIGGRRLWRDFQKKARPDLDKPEAWAAAVEFIMSEQTMRDLTQAAVGKNYQVGLTTMLPHVKQIKKTLNIRGLDERYTAFNPAQIVLKNEPPADGT